MNRGLLVKTFYDVWPITLVFMGALAGVEAMLAYVIPTILWQYSEQMLEMAWVQKIVSGLLGAELGAQWSPGGLRSFIWAHPVVLATVWAQEIAFCTRMPAGETDRGTVDMLVSLPVSRFRIYACETAAWIISGLVLLMAGVVGNQIGALFGRPEVRGLTLEMGAVVVNLYCMYLAVGAMTLLVSSLSDRRGPAVGVAFGVVAASFLLSFLGQFWPVAQRVSFLSVMHYYRPLVVVRSQGWPVGDMAVLLTAALVLWGLGAIVFSRRDIRTV